jgi:hypothetical protein
MVWGDIYIEVKLGGKATKGEIKGGLYMPHGR